ncbi:MAG: AAA domain-containing protein [bacterium]|nr:AAA domain-containing protein [bacterium]
MNKNDFFRETSLQICGNLEIEEALAGSFKIVQKLMPVDRMYLEVFDKNYSAMRIIATASKDGCGKMDVLAPLSEEARASANRSSFPGLQDAFVFNAPADYAISRELLAFLDVECTSLMVMLLNSDEKVLGALVLITESDEKYTKEHAALISLLKEPFTIAMSNTMKHREVSKLKELLADDNRFLQGELRRISGDEIIGANFSLQGVMEKVRQVAPLDSPVLLLGETGVGKDVIANAIHSISPRGSGPFICVNCGAIPETLIDSELFGHEKGAFTAAVSQKRGRFERADKGTIFLDEIGELTPQAQVRLLRVLQNREIERVGGTKTIPLDIRIIAATNKELEAGVSAGEFRQDLWFRLNVFPMTIPPLRERKEDIPALLQHFVNLKTRELKLPSFPTISPDTVDILMDYDWPGNVRELENVVERALILHPKNSGHGGATSSLDFGRLNIGKKTKVSIPGGSSESDRLDDVVSAHIRRILAATDGRIHGTGGAADILGLNPSTLRNRMNKLGISYGRANKQ